MLPRFGGALLDYLIEREKTMLSKTDQRTLTDIMIHAKLGNMNAAGRIAAAWVRSAASNAVKNKRMDALKDAGLL